MFASNPGQNVDGQNVDGQNVDGEKKRIYNLLLKKDIYIVTSIS